MRTYEYVAPPAPEERRVADRRMAGSGGQLWLSVKGNVNRRVEDRRKSSVIFIPEKEGTPVTVLTYSNGMTFYMKREAWDWDAARRVTEAIEDFLYGMEGFMAFPPSSMPDLGHVPIPRKTLETLLNIHDEVVQSPLAIRHRYGQRVIVAQPGDKVIQGHGPGKRRK
jgi:hypothetical protein